MTRTAVLTLCAALVACDQRPEERIAELDDAATVDCGRQSSEYAPPALAQEMVTCMNDALAGGVRAKVVLDFEIDFVSHIYTVDGAFVHLEGFTELDGEDHYHEYRCATFEATETTISGMTYAQVGTADCQEVRDW
jgi:hypothetical protein